MTTIPFTVSNGCACCEACAAHALQCRSRGGVAQLYGFPEYTDHSAPPRAYRTKALGGGARTKLYTDASGAVPYVPAVQPASISPSWSGGNSTVAVSVRVAADGTCHWSATQAATAPSPIATRVSINVESVNVVFVARSSATPSRTDGGTFGAGVGQTIYVDAWAVSDLTGLPEPLYGGAGNTLTLQAGTGIEESLDWSGASAIATGGAQTDAGAVSGELFDPATGLMEPASASGLASAVADAASRLGAGLFAAPELTPTQLSALSSGGTAEIGTSGLWRKLISCDAADTLSAEDTEEAAIGRLLAGAGGRWGAWFTIPRVGVCVAEWEERGMVAPGVPDFSLAYYEAQWRMVAGGLTADTAYRARVHYLRRPYGSGESLELFAEESASGTSSAVFPATVVIPAGAGTPDPLTGVVAAAGGGIDVPNERGYQTQPGASRLCTTDPADLPA